MAMAIDKKGPTILRVPVAAVAALVLAACGGGGGGQESANEQVGPAVEGRPPTTTTLSGTWLQVDDPSWRLVRFSPAGTFAFDDRGELATSPAAKGRFELKGGTITFTSEGSDVCEDGDSWAWQAGVPEVGRLHIVYTEEATGQCRIPVGTEWKFIRVSPASPAGNELADADTAEGEPPTVNDLIGRWQGAQDSLELLINPDGTFAIDNGGALTTDPSVLGTYKLDGDTITFTNETGHACVSGDNWAWQSAIDPPFVLHIEHTEVGTGNCEVDLGTKWVFVRVSSNAGTGA